MKYLRTKKKCLDITIGKQDESMGILKHYKNIVLGWFVRHLIYKSSSFAVRFMITILNNRLVLFLQIRPPHILVLGCCHICWVVFIPEIVSVKWNLDMVPTHLGKFPVFSL